MRGHWLEGAVVTPDRAAAEAAAEARYRAGLRSLLRRRELAREVADRLRELLPLVAELASTVAVVDHRNIEYAGLGDKATSNVASRIDVAANGCESIAYRAAHKLSVSDRQGLPVDLVAAINQALQNEEER